MPRPRNAVPTYRLHSSRNCGKVVVNDDTVYFPGPFNSPESLAAYGNWLTHYLATGEVRSKPQIRLDELILLFDSTYLAVRYRQTGERTQTE